MKKKLLVITVGTVAASFGLEVLKQARTHSRDLEVMVRYIDTANLSSYYPSIHSEEWFQMSIDPQRVRTIYSDPSQLPHIENRRYPDLLPATNAFGGEGIRYNGAMALEIQRDSLSGWIGANMEDLAGKDNYERYISIALIVSPMGATGSSSLEALIEVITSTAYTTQIPIRCDVFILQPSFRRMTDMELANTLAFYAELAASELISTRTNGQRRVLGRKIVVGWGKDYVLSSIEQLRAATATLVQFATSSASPWVTYLHEAEMDNYASGETDPISNLPMHLSTGTAITIGMNDLIEQIIDNDVTHLLELLVSATTSAGSQPNILLGKFATVLTGNNVEDMYYHLLDHLSDVVDPARLNAFIDGILLANLEVDEKIRRLLRAQQMLNDEIEQRSQKKRELGKTITTGVIADIEHIQRKRICQGGLSLFELHEEFLSLQMLLNSILQVAHNPARGLISSDSSTSRQLQVLDGVTSSSEIADPKQLANVIKSNLQERLRDKSAPFAIKILKDLEQYCIQVRHSLENALQYLRQLHNDNGAKVTGDREFTDNNHPLHLMAFSTPKEIMAYTQRISIFSDSPERWVQTSSIDPHLDFRQRLEGGEGIDALLRGDSDFIKKEATTYIKEKVSEKIGVYNIVEALLQANERALPECLVEAMRRATPLINYDEDFTPKRREFWYVNADYSNDEQRKRILDAMSEVFPQGNCQLVKSNDPTKIVLLYYADGLPMSALNGLTGRCLNTFLKRRGQWHSSKTSADQHMENLLYSSKDAERAYI